MTRCASTASCSAYPPHGAWAMTRSPAFHWVTPSPTADTTPATSAPGVKGSSGCSWYFFWMISESGKLTPAACTSTSTSPAFGTGDATSSTTSDSGGPHCLQTTALIDLSWQNGPARRGVSDGFYRAARTSPERPAGVAFRSIAPDARRTCVPGRGQTGIFGLHDRSPLAALYSGAFRKS